MSLKPPFSREDPPTLPAEGGPSDLLESQVMTPWGEAQELRQRKLHPGSRIPREQVDRIQRERLFGAAIAVVSENGFEATRVADIIKVGGVSRSDFYKHFDNKSDCLVAAAESLLSPVLTALAGEAAKNPDPQRTFEGFVHLIHSQRAAARVFFVELYAAGPAGEAAAAKSFEAIAGELQSLSSRCALGEQLGQDLVWVLAAGLCKFFQTRLYRDQGDLRAVAPDLWRWVQTIKMPPRALEQRRRQRPGAAARFEGYTPAERIARAVATVVAEKGYAAMNTNDIAAEAAISLSTFYAHFRDKHDAVLATLEMSGAQIMALAVPAARRAGDWPNGVRALFEAVCAYLGAEPAFARLLTEGVYGAGPRALARRDRVIDSLAEMLTVGLEENHTAPEVSAEAIGATVYALMREQIRREGPENLLAIVPLATYLTLVGFVGPDQACSIANAEAQPG